MVVRQPYFQLIGPKSCLFPLTSDIEGGRGELVGKQYTKILSYRTDRYPYFNNGTLYIQSTELTESNK